MTADGPLHLELTDLSSSLPPRQEQRMGLVEPSELDIDDDEMNDPHVDGIGGDIPSAVTGIIKGMVGPALLYLPHGFATAGWFLSIPVMLIATALFLASSSALLESWKLETIKGFDKLENITEEEGENDLTLTVRLNGNDINGNGDAIMKAHETTSTSNGDGKGEVKRRRVTLSYPELARRALGAPGEAVVKIGIALMQSGVCLTYLIFVPHNLKASTKTLMGLDVPATRFVFVMLLFQVPLSWIRDIRRLTVTNLMANALILYGLMTCLVFAFASAVESDLGRGPVAEITYKMFHLDAFNPGWFLFIGTSVLLFEGSITLLVPLQEAVETEEDRLRFPVIYKRVILGIISFYLFFGITCWMSFGNDINTVMTTSLPPGLMATTVQLAYSLAVIFTFPLQNFPSLEIACRSLAASFQSMQYTSNYPILQNRNVIASTLVCLLAVVAVCTMERLDKVVSLTGSLLGCPLAFVMPPIIHNRLDPNLSQSVRIKNHVVAGCGLVAMVLASVTTILTW